MSVVVGIWRSGLGRWRGFTSLDRDTHEQFCPLRCGNVLPLERNGDPHSEAHAVGIVTLGTRKTVHMVATKQRGVRQIVHLQHLQNFPNVCGYE